ncbi:MAG: DUF350 domain-containing protein [Verrucomicrobiales bacterium]|nr:DUF350 domain-containing protein [Verrucomicrobiales bacterium]
MKPAIPHPPAARRLGLFAPSLLFAAAEVSWTPATVASGILAMAVFSVAGVVLALLGYKIFDRFTTGDLHREIMEHKNVAAAILAAAVVLGICIIVAAAMIG